MTSSENVEKQTSRHDHSQEEPLSKREPSAPFALVGLSYLIILTLAGMLIGIYLYFN